MTTGLIQEIYNGNWRIEKSFADGYLPLLKSFLDGNLSNQDFSHDRLESSPRYVTFKNGVYTLSSYGDYASPEAAPSDSIALLKVHGAITYYDQYCGSSGMSTKTNLLDRMAQNPNINAIVLEIRSGGGEGFASQKFSNEISKIEKPVIAFVEDYAMSAAYEIAAACDWITANTPSAVVGSIGTYITIADLEQYWKNEGIRLIEVYAQKSSDKNKDYYEALKGNTSLVQANADTFNEFFLAEIKSGRGSRLTAGEETWGTGKTFFAEEALSLGLVDEIASFREVIQSLENSFKS
jgi:signal peptide peptidase SppA